MSLEERYDEVRQLIEMGKQKGCLLNDEVSELLPADITTSDELFTAYGNPGIEVADSEQKYRPGFPIWPWYSTARTSRRALISGAPT